MNGTTNSAKMSARWGATDVGSTGKKFRIRNDGHREDGLWVY